MISSLKENHFFLKFTLKNKGKNHFFQKQFVTKLKKITSLIGFEGNTHTILDWNGWNSQSLETCWRDGGLSCIFPFIYLLIDLPEMGWVLKWWRNFGLTSQHGSFSLSLRSRLISRIFVCKTLNPKP